MIDDVCGDDPDEIARIRREGGYVGCSICGTSVTRVQLKEHMKLHGADLRRKEIRAYFKNVL